MSNKQTMKFGACVLECLPDMDESLMQKWIENPKALKEVLERSLRKIDTVKLFKTWKTIKLGTFKNVDEIRKALKAKENFISDWANDILGEPAFKVSETEQDVELVNVSVEELGFKNSARYADICKRALELGLDLCPAEVGPQLRLQFKDQPKGTYVVVAMEAITDSDGNLFVFFVKRVDDGERYLSANSGYADLVWNAHYRFVFLRRK